MTIDLFDAPAAELAEERAAIREFDGLMTREEAERLGKLDAEEWRFACEVRTLLAMPPPQCRAMLDGIEKVRGKTAADPVREAVKREWLARKATARP